MYKYYDCIENNKIIALNNGEYCDLDLPKGYFLTPKGYLYNTSKHNGHRYNNLVNEYEYIINLLNKNKSLKDLNVEINYYKNKLESIKKFKYIDYESLINWIYSVYEINSNISFDIKDNNIKKNNQVILTDLYKGFCDAYIEFYNYFYNNDLNNYNSINDILGNVNIYDKTLEILVRCIGFHKIELHGSKNITTASIHPVSDFYDYLINGYNVWVVPKIINDNGFKEVDLTDFIPISSYTAIENFEEENPDKGKVRILGM